MRGPFELKIQRRSTKADGEGRPAFTLLEVMLAMAIGVVLLGALYVAINVQIRHAQSARVTVEESTLVRALFSRMAQDIRSCLTAPASLAPSSNPSSSGSGASGAAAQTGATTGSSSGSTTTP